MQTTGILKAARIFIIGLLLWIAGCIQQADRDNPLDPNSPRFKNQGNISGKVYTYYPPYRPISGADVLLKPGHYWAVSDQNGDFAFENLPVATYRVVAQCSGYDGDSILVEVKPSANQEAQFNLNGRPRILDYKIVAGHLSQWYPFDDQYFIQTSVEVFDPDGIADIKNVQLTMPDFNFTDTLDYTNNPAIFKAEIDEEHLPIHQILGHPFIFQIEDNPGSRFESSPIFVVRIIRESPETVSPQGSSSVGPKPRLVWNKLELPFPFTYTIEVHRVEQGGIIRTLVCRYEKIYVNEYWVGNDLLTGDYIWTVSVVDEFDNWSRSREAAFRVD